MNINLHIERLVLDGVAVSRPALLEAALAAEVKRLLAAGHLSPLLRRGGVMTAMRTAPVTMSRDSAAMGTEIGRAVHAGLSGDSIGRDPLESKESK